MNKSFLIILALICMAILLIAPVTAKETASVFGSGCTPGFWKNHLDAWPNEFPPSLTIMVNLNGDQEEDTALDALSYKGGNDIKGAKRIFLRAYITADLNKVVFEDAYPIDDITLAEALDAYLFGDRQEMLDFATQLDAANNGDCPL